MSTEILDKPIDAPPPPGDRAPNTGHVPVPRLDPVRDAERSFPALIRTLQELARQNDATLVPPRETALEIAGLLDQLRPVLLPWLNAATGVAGPMDEAPSVRALLDEALPERPRLQPTELIERLVQAAEHSNVARAAVGALLSAEATALTRSLREQRSGAGDTAASASIQNDLSLVLDSIDVLALNDLASLSLYCEALQRQNQERRARALLERALQRRPQHASTLDALRARLMMNAGQVAAARSVLAGIEERHGLDAQGHVDLARAASYTLDHSTALRHYDQAAAMSDADTRAQIAREQSRVVRLRDYWQRSLATDALPVVSPDAEERSYGQFMPDSLELAAAQYERYGTLVLDQLFDAAWLERCREQFMQQYQSYFQSAGSADALKIGDRRFQISLELSGEFNSRALYGNPFVLQLMHRLLGREHIIGCTVAATSLPGAAEQHLHKDHRALFTDNVQQEPAALPPVSITLMVPLVALDEQVGSTQLAKGTHRMGSERSASMPLQVPHLPLGSAFLMDLSLSHKGMANRSNTIRPIINMVYHRRWFVDNKNFDRQPPLRIPPAEFARIDPELRYLFDYTLQPGPEVERRAAGV